MFFEEYSSESFLGVVGKFMPGVIVQMSSAQLPDVLKLTSLSRGRSGRGGICNEQKHESYDGGGVQANLDAARPNAENAQ